MKGIIGSKNPNAITQKTSLVPYESKDLFGTNLILRKVGSFLYPELLIGLSIKTK